MNLFKSILLYNVFFINEKSTGNIKLVRHIINCIPKKREQFYIFNL